MLRNAIDHLFFSPFFISDKMRCICMIIVLIVLFKLTIETNVIVKKLANIGFTEKHYTLRKDLGTKEFFDYVAILEQSGREMTNVCDSLEYKNNCNKKIENFKNSIELLKIDINYAKTTMRSRSKRNSAAIVVVGSAISIKTFVVTAFFSMAIATVTSWITMASTWKTRGGYGR